MPHMDTAASVTGLDQVFMKYFNLMWANQRR